MARKLKIEAPDAPKGCCRPGMEQRTYDIEVITPLFGGGVEAGKNDPVTRVRVPGIRGQLRFWWRATRGAACADAAALRNREVEIWGDTDHPSKVRVRVETPEGARQPEPSAWAKFQPQRNNPDRLQVLPTPERGCESFPRYALHAFNGKVGYGGTVIEKEPAKKTDGLRFRLVVDFPTGLEDDVECAVWAWTNFGGLGARTRRGCGALACKMTACGSSQEMGQWLEDKFTQYGLQQATSTKPWPVLMDSLFLGGSGDALRCWSDAVSPLQDYRQGKEIGRNKGDQPNRPGRSRWPEADSLRALTGAGHHDLQKDHRKSETITFPQGADRNQKLRLAAFPRTEFGLPIVMHFKDPGDSPNDGQLGARIDQMDGYAGRMASPLILRPIKFADGKVSAMILRLRTEPLAGIVMVFDDRNRSALNWDAPGIRRPDVATYRNSPMAGRSKAGSALEAFLHFIEHDKQFNKVI